MGPYWAPSGAHLDVWAHLGSANNGVWVGYTQKPYGAHMGDHTGPIMVVFLLGWLGVALYIQNEMTRSSA